MNIKNFLSNKKNKRILLFILVIVLFFLLFQVLIPYIKLQKIKKESLRQAYELLKPAPQAEPVTQEEALKQVYEILKPAGSN